MIRRLPRRLFSGYARGGDLPAYRPVDDSVLAALSPGAYWTLECPAAGRDLTIKESGWFWECRDCGRRGGPFPGQRAADEDWHTGPHRTRPPY